MMKNRPNPEVFAYYSYRLAYVSSGIVLLSIIISIIPGPITGALSNIIWLALVSGIAGTFMGFAASSDFKRVPGSAEAVHAARVGFRLNLFTTIVVVAIAVIGFVGSAIASMPIQVQP
jgi:hypothetical protein